VVLHFLTVAAHPTCRHPRCGSPLPLAFAAPAGASGRRCRAFSLAASHDRDLAFSTRLGADRLRDFLFNRNRNDGDCWVGLNSGNRQSTGHEGWCKRMVGNSRSTAGYCATSDSPSIEPPACNRPPLIAKSTKRDYKFRRGTSVAHRQLPICRITGHLDRPDFTCTVTALIRTFTG
jgi:hypothetical protein